MRDFSSADSEAELGSPHGPDALSQILLGLRLDGVEYGRCVLNTPWAVAFPAQRWARFHFVRSGGCWVRTHATPWTRLRSGDAVLLPQGTFHVLASSPDAPAIDIDSLARVTISESVYLVDGRSASSLTTVVPRIDPSAPSDAMFCGALRFNLDPLHPLLTMLPEVLLASDLSGSDSTVPSLLDAMEREVQHARVGACGILARLADVLAASIIRAWVERSAADASGWVAALRCPKVGKVVAAIHRAPERAWTLPLLAKEMGASRTSFAEAFTRTVGESPAKYVAKVRMFQARQWIAHENMRVATAAERLGYDSEASFSRAFKRIFGHPPSGARVDAAPRLLR